MILPLLTAGLSRGLAIVGDQIYTEAYNNEITGDISDYAAIISA